MLYGLYIGGHPAFDDSAPVTGSYGLYIKPWTEEDQRNADAVLAWTLRAIAQLAARQSEQHGE